MLDWLIVGGGVHGTFFSHYLTSQAGVSRERLRVLDPEDEPLACWYHCCTNTGMQFMRSPDVHNLDLDAMALRTHCFDTWKEPEAALLEPYGRPSFALFQDHTAKVIGKYGLRELRLRGRAQSLRSANDHFIVETENGTIETNRLLLAIGSGEQPHWPVWALEMRRQGASIDHVFNPAFKRGQLPSWRHAVVVGGGITAVQTALAMSERLPGTVTLLTRHSLRIEMFDANPCWIGDACMGQFERAGFRDRRRMIDQARNRGSVPYEIASQLFSAIQSGKLTLTCGEIGGAKLLSEERVQLTVQDGLGEPHSLAERRSRRFGNGFREKTARR